MILILDNAESLLDPQGADAREIYAVAEELSRFKTICLCITSRLSTVPQHCKRPMIPTLSLESACDIFFSIYDNGNRSDIIDNLLKRLDFHPLSITLLATIASHNMWDYNRLAQEWNTHRTQMLRTNYNESLAATIELSLASPTFHELGPDARELLGIVAFFPQGVNESGLDWLFPTTSNRRNIFDKFSILSLTYRSNGFITMLAPLRDYFYPKDPALSPLLCATRDRYFRRLSVDVYPDKPGYEEARWIALEDANVEHLLDAFTSIDSNSADIWVTCCNFMEHLYWHKPRLVILGPKIEGLPDDHPSKPQCLLGLSLLFYSVGNHTGEKQLLTHSVKIWKERGNDAQVARALVFLAEVNGFLGLRKGGIEQAREALEIYERLNDATGQAHSLQFLASLLQRDKQLDAAEEAVSRAIDLLPAEGGQFRACQCHRFLGKIHSSKGKTEGAIDHFETALRIASSFNWHREQLWIYCSLAELFFSEKRFYDADIHVKRAKSHAIDVPYGLGHAMRMQARIWYKQCRLEEAESEALCAADVFENIGAAKDVERCRTLAREIRAKMERPIASGESDSNGALLNTAPLPTIINSSSLARGTRHHPTRPSRHVLP